MLLYAVTIFLSAFLLFQVQPIAARAILPWFGGTSAVWTTCLLFFQVELLLGYLYAHWSVTRLTPRTQARVHVSLLVLSLAALPIIPRAALKPTGAVEPISRILLTLFATVGLPYLLLSTTGPLLQAWYAATASVEGGKRPFPYPLYALSNVGSMLALLSYPVIVEPWLTLRWQAYSWSGAYVLFAVLCAVVATRARAGSWGASPRADVVGAEPAPTYWMKLTWVTLAACASSLLLAVTTHLSQNVAAIPFLWVLPLSLYLLSFIVCFGAREWRWTPAFLAMPAVAISAMTFLISENSNDTSVATLIAVFGGGLFVCCVLCHGELARLKPHPRYLTSFYLMLSVGGALGGVFVGVAAPLLFRGYWELQLSLGACALIALFVVYRNEATSWLDPSWLILAALTGWLLFWLYTDSGVVRDKSRLVARNFYGVLTVVDSGQGTGDAERSLYHGTILHGEQYLDAARRRTTTTYYVPQSGVGLAVREAQTRPNARIGVVGLGTGTMASYGRRGDLVKFYDINPLVVQIASSQFTFLNDCPATVRIAMGDARLTLEREPSQQFDVLVLDAFSGDAIPVHLLTREACRLYFRHLKPGGVLAVHISNLYLDLEPVVARIADELHCATRTITYPDTPLDNTIASEWVLVTRRRSLFFTPTFEGVGAPASHDRRVRTWTDDYSNLYQILK